MANLDEKKIETTIESLDVNDDKLIFVLLDGEISVKASLFEKHIFFGNLTTSSTKESSCRLNLQLTLSDFFQWQRTHGHSHFHRHQQRFWRQTDRTEERRHQRRQSAGSGLHPQRHPLRRQQSRLH